MAPSSKICPGCEVAMVPFLAKGVEIDCCPKCGGLWFDFGELTRVAGRKAELELMGGHTSRRCAFCRISMEPALLPGAIPVEACTACRGIYLDEDELEEFARGHVSMTPRDGHPWKRARPEQRKETSTAAQPQGFECVRCGLRFPYSEGNALRGGLACRSCTPRPQTTEAERRSANRDSDLGHAGGPDVDFDFDFGFD
ncbi:zf-TFIIB domain-containing protein [Archangium violaceum]|uniref:TFIIB-type zinc ribbon-containing protein n=1 Tax=Archangium violaceum TaxID=83451 RepID=UPI00194E6EFE|nr:zf-TFIIB domain-containing protein [Archangium violaceum]QRN96295.1 zf-TFIIB domain-containing protein [Archangium violaceum]